MRHYLYVGAETCYEFKTRAKAFIFASKNEIKDFILLSKGYENLDGSQNEKVSVFNTFLVGENQVEYLDSERDALIYIGSFLT